MTRLAMLLMIGFLVVGCMDDVYNYEECMDIETARCDLRKECDSGFDRATCVNYYGEFCRTRKIKESFSDQDLADCLDAIGALAPGECDYINTTSKNELCDLPISECAFICPDEEESDGGTDAG